MKQIFTLLTLMILGSAAWAQTVVTYAGIAHMDPTTNYTSTSTNVDLDDTYFASPNGMCFDPNGRMWISENNKIRMVAGGKIFIRSGGVSGPTFTEGYQNANGIQARYRVPGGMVSDADGNIYIADGINHCIRKLDKYINVSNSQSVSTFAGANPTAGLPGNGTAGSADGTGTAARFDTPKDITMDADGNFYVTDYNNFTIRKISPSGVVTTLAGSAGNEGSADGTGNVARFGGPWGIAMYDENHVVVTDQWNTNIRLVNITTGEATTLAGPDNGPSAGYVDGSLANARFIAPKGVVVINGIIYVADKNVIRAIDVDNDEVSTFVGDQSSFGLTDGSGANATFTEISDLATDGRGYIYVSENSIAINSNVIRRVAIDDLVASADFVATEYDVAIDEKTTITDVSGGTEPTSRTWTITPGSYTVHSGSLNGSEAIELSFQVTGFYKVKLDIDTEYGPDSKEEANYISVSTSSNSIKNNADDQFAVYPNPANNEVSIELAADWTFANTTISVYNIEGQLVATVIPGETLNTSSFTEGVYYIAVESEGRFGVQKLMIQR
ncbi:T9SS type A sorting domain-containing protein [bacterium]|nr:T9SS type A sorting domain-containing protein [bacterium]